MPNFKIGVEGEKDFLAALKQMNAELKVLDSEMKLTASTFQGQDKSVQALAARNEALSKSFDKQQEMVQSIRAALEESAASFGENDVKTLSWTARLNNAQAELNKLDTKLKENNVALHDAVAKMDESASATQGLKNGLDSLESGFEQNEKAIKNSEVALHDATSKMDESASATQGLKNELGSLQSGFEQNEKAIKNSEVALQDVQGEIDTTKAKLQSLMDDAIQKDADVFQNNLLKFSAWIGTSLVAAGVAATKVGIEYESAFAGVRKTIDATEEQFQVLNNGIRSMSKEIPMSASSIAELAESAGQLGIKTENVLGFTRVVADLGVATNIIGQEGASQIARFANIVGMSQTDFDKFGSSIVALGNNFATTEAEILSMSMRLAGAGAQVGMSEADILGLATALTSVGIEAEMGGSAISKVLINMSAAGATADKLNGILGNQGISLRDLQMMASHSSDEFKSLAQTYGLTAEELKTLMKQGSNLENFAKISGMTANEFRTAFGKDAVATLQRFIGGLSNAENAGSSAIEMLQEMGITEVRLRDSLLRSASAGNLLTDAVQLSNSAWLDNIALTNEAEQRYATTESKLQLLKNAASDVGISLFGMIQEPVVTAVEGLAKGLDWVSDNINNLVKIVTTATIAIGGFTAAWTIGNTISKVAQAIEIANAAIATATGLTGANTVVLGANTVAETLRAAAVKVGMSVNAAGQLITEAGTVATTAETAALLASTGAISMKTLAIGVVTGKISLATAAQWLWNAAMTANPIGLLIAGVAALGAGIYGLVKWIDKQNDSFRQQVKEINDLNESSQRITQTTRAMTDALSDSNGLIGENALSTRTMVDNLEDLISKQSEQGEQTAGIQALVGLLNNSIQGLNLSYDEQTNSLNMSTDALNKQADAMMERAKLKAYEDMLSDAIREQTLAKSAQAKADDILLEKVNALNEATGLQFNAYEDLQGQIDNYVGTADFVAGHYIEEIGLVEEAQVAYGNLGLAYDETGKAIGDITNAINSIPPAINESTEAVISGTEDQTYAMQAAAQAQIDAIESMLGVQSDAVNELRDSYSDIVAAATDMNNKIGEGSKVNLEDMLKTQEHNIAATEDWADNLVKLSERAATGNYDALEQYIDQLRAAGPKSAAEVAAWAGATEGQLRQLNANFERGGETAGEAFRKSLGDTDIPDTVMNLITKTSSTLEQRIKAADFEGLGKSIDTGLVNGIEKNGKLVLKAMKQLTDDTTNEGKTGFDSHSPSRVFMDIGEDVVQGLANGIKSGQNDAIAAIESISNSIINITKSILQVAPPSIAFVEMGKSIVDGIGVGINNTSGSLLGTVSGLMNSLLTTAKATLGIHSPSADFAKYVGEPISEGVAVGVDKKAKKAKQSAEKLAKDVFTSAKTWIEQYRFEEDYLASEELKMWDMLGAKYAKGTKERVEADKSASKLRRQIAKEEFDRSKNWIDERKFYGEISLSEEIKAWERVQSRYVEGSKEFAEAEKNLFTLRNKLEEEHFKNLTNWVDLRRNYNMMSTQDEIAFWMETSQQYVEGSKEREEADKSLMAARQRLFDESEKLTEQMTAAEEKYQNAVDSRAQAISNTFNLFDELHKKEDTRAKAAEDAEKKLRDIEEKIRKAKEETTDDIAKQQEVLKGLDKELTEATQRYADARILASKTEGQILTENLRGQVEEMRDWSSNIQELATKGIDKGLLAELQVMGPKANAEINALSEMTAAELTDYSNLWAEKHKIAREMAIKELEPLRKETDDKITELTDLLNEKAGTDFVYAGANTIDGFIEGIKSGFSDLKDAIEEMARIAVDSARDALDIHSPSKLFKDMGKNVGIGFISGIDAMANAVQKTVSGVFSNFADASIGIQPIVNSVGNRNANEITAANNPTIINNYATFQVRVDEIDDVHKLLQIFKNFGHNKIVFEGI